MNAALPRYSVVQNAFIVADLDRAIERLSRLVGYGPWLRLRHATVPRVTYRGKDTTYSHSAAFTQAGPVQIELIELHDDQPSAFQQMYPRGTTGFHHTALFVDDFPAAVRGYEDAGFPCVQLYELPGNKAVAFIDTTAVNGHMIEVLEESEVLRQLYSTVAGLASTHEPDAVVDVGSIAEL